MGPRATRRVAAIALLLAGAAGASVLGWHSALPKPAETGAPNRAESGAPDVAAAGPAPRSALDDLSRQLAEERAARARLEEAVAALEERVAVLTAANMPDSRPADPAEFSTTTEAGDARQAETIQGGPGRRRDLDEEALVAAGFSASEAAALEERWESFEMERLYLRDQATREGWLGTPRFGEEQRALDAREEALRGELGDDSWDWVLYAAGRPNRVVVQSVLERSPAGEAGLKPGDVILGYAGQRVFDGEELRAATAQGRAGESVSVEILRDNAPQRLFVPRGPLGIRLGLTSAEPPGRHD